MKMTMKMMKRKRKKKKKMIMNNKKYKDNKEILKVMDLT
jgi:hypothetical protein